jgi:aldose 1-epimerase
MPLPDRLTIRSGPMTARFSPRQGGRMTHLSHDSLGDILVPMPEGEFDPWNWPKAGAYPLFPYHNRLAGAGFEYDGQARRLLPHPALGVDAMHGPAHRRVWSVRAHSGNAIEIGLRYPADPEWPFDFTAVQRFHLRDDRLDIALSLKNTGQTAMPGGFGWHPYLAARRDRPVHCDALLNWPLDELAIPTGRPAEARSPEPPLPPGDFTIHLSQWQSAVAALDGGGRLVISADAAFPHLVAHRTATYVCLEPVSHVAGLFGFAPAQRQAAGLLRLEPGQQVSGNLVLTVGT